MHMTVITVVSGLLMCLGSFFTMRGNIYASVCTFLVVDLCWVVLSFLNKDVIGFTLTFIGVTMCFTAFVKMHRGTMKKHLNEK